MKRIYLIIGIIGTLLLSCEDDSNEAKDKSLVIDENIELCAGECATDNNLSICFDSVSSDSRCASDVICAWEGNAAVEMTFTLNEQDYNLTLNTNRSNRFPADTTIKQFRIKLIDLEPTPVSTSTIAQKDYVATIEVGVLED